MNSTMDDIPPPELSPPSSDWPSHGEIEPREPRNILILAAHQIVLRIGWMFKTESVIIPAFLDSVAGAGWLRGCLPILNRLGQSVPPVFWAERLKATRYKKRALAAFTLLMSLSFGLLSAVCFATEGQRSFWIPGLFLGLYFVFFVFTGLYLLSFGTLQGKLVRPMRRGRLLLVSTFWGTIPAIVVAMLLMPRWFTPATPEFGSIFAFVAIAFFFSSLIALLAFEPPDENAGSTGEAQGILNGTWQALRQDANLRRLVLVVILANSGLLIFPHYQALAGELGLSGVHLMYWVIAQSASVGLLSVLVGTLADARGNRLSLQLLIIASAITPAFAVLLPHLGRGLGAGLFWLVFVTMGVTPLVQRIVVNYTLEICETAQHARYLSIVSLYGAAPFLFAPVVGWLYDFAGYDCVFVATVCAILLSGLLSLRLEEPRHRIGREDASSVGIGADT